MKKERNDARSETEASTFLGASERTVVERMISERRLHRSALLSMHAIFRREDTRRILDGLPFQGLTTLPLVSEKEGKACLRWMSCDTPDLLSDLKTWRGHYLGTGSDVLASAAHALFKKVQVGGF
jgi:hypothetical protein